MFKYEISAFLLEITYQFILLSFKSYLHD